MELKNDFNKDGSKKSKKVRTVNEKKVKKLLKDTKFKKEFE